MAAVLRGAASGSLGRELYESQCSLDHRCAAALCGAAGGDRGDQVRGIRHGGTGAGHPVFSEKCPAGPALPGGEPARRPAALPDPSVPGDWGGLLWTDRGVSFGPLPSHRLWRVVAVPPAAGAGDGIRNGGAGGAGKQRLSFGGGMDADTVCAVEFSRMAFGGGSAVGGSGQGTGPDQERSEEAWNLSFER